MKDLSYQPPSALVERQPGAWSAADWWISHARQTSWQPVAVAINCWCKYAADHD